MILTSIIKPSSSSTNSIRFNNIITNPYVINKFKIAISNINNNDSWLLIKSIVAVVNIGLEIQTTGQLFAIHHIHAIKLKYFDLYD